MRQGLNREEFAVRTQGTVRRIYLSHQELNRFRLRLEELEEREVPSLTITFDFGFDTSGFFSDASRRNLLQQAANEVAARLNPGFQAITPSGSNSWTLSFFNPSTGAIQYVSNRTIQANQIIIYVGGRDLPGNQAAVGGFGGYSSSGSSQWNSLVATRGAGSRFATWGGSIAFDTHGTPWSFSATSDVQPGTIDFYTVVQHELGHVLGIGTSQQWRNLISNNFFVGPNAQAIHGGPVPLSPDGAHWADGVPGGGCFCPSCTGAARAASNQASMDPSSPYGQRIGFSELDFAALKDLGWGIKTPAEAYGTVSPPVTAPPPVSPPPPPVTAAVPPVATPSPPVAPPAPPSPPASPPPAPTPRPANPPAPPLLQSSRGGQLVAISGGWGTVQVYEQRSDGYLHAITGSLKPFSNYHGVVRSTIGDFNGDGIPDLAVGTGAGVVAAIRVYNGRDLSDLVGITHIFGSFGNGVFLAAGDVNRDGRDELAVSTDVGSSQVNVYDFRSRSLVLLASFFAFDDPGFRGGARIAMGDINKDGAADLVATAGPGGGPRVAVINGLSIATGGNRRLFNDFFAYDHKLRTGAYVAVGDLNGDGFGEIVFSADVGGSSRTIAYSGALLTANPLVDPMTLPFLFSQFATPENLPYGTRVTLKDLDNDGKAEMIFTTAKRSDGSLRMITSEQILSPSRPTNRIQFPYSTTIDGWGLYIG